jgi:hypothetical protein
MTDAYNWTAQHGIVKWSDYYHGYMKRQAKCKEPKNVTRFFNTGAREEANMSNDALKFRLSKQPVGAAYYSDLKCMDYYKSGVIMADDCNKNASDPEKKEVNHAVTIVGYGKSERKECKEYWLIKNSWGTHWGEDGHFRLCADRVGKHETYG